MKLVSRVGLAVIVATFGCMVACAAAKEQPRQASTPDPADPMTDPSNPGSSGPSSTPSKNNNAGGGDPLPPMGGKTATGKGGEAPQVASVAAYVDGVKWGMSHNDLSKQYTQTGGVIWKDYDEKLAKARVGPEQTALEAEREQAKAAFGRSFIEFKDTPTGYDTTGIRAEYTYRNKEALMWIQRQGRKRYFFFINDRLWKIYDEVPLEEGGPMGTSFADATAKINAQVNGRGRSQPADAAKSINYPTVDWKDSTSHLRAIDRSGEKVVGVSVAELATVSNLAALRPNKPVNNDEIDPSIIAVTKGTNRVDPNAPSSSGSAAPKKAPPPKKK